MWSRFFLLLGVVQFGYCQFLGLGFGDFDGLNPFFLNNNNNNNNFPNLGLGIRQHHGKCSNTLNGATQDGVCLSRPECTLSGGRVGGRTGCALGICCVYSNGCSQTSNKRVTYFENTATNNIDTCQYIVRAENNNICQMRLDFESFNFPKAARATSQDATGAPILSGPFLCRDAYLQVTSPNTGRIPVLCGNNDGQHIYVPVNGSLGQRQLVLDIVNNRNTNNNGVALNWRIKVTQLECPTLTKVQKSLRVWEDSLMTAPDGCLQYHTESSGRIRNLGYDESVPLAQNTYQANLNYAICFRRLPDACGVSYNLIQFRLPGSSQGTSADCTSNMGTVDLDYLFVPNGKLSGVDNGGTTMNPVTVLPITIRNQNRYCGDWLAANSIIQETTPGPLYIFFRTDGLTNDLTGTGMTTPAPTDPTQPVVNNIENGWVMTYNILRGNNC